MSITEKGASNGVSADIDGAFKFNVSSGNATIVVSFTGYKTQEIQLKGRNSVGIELVAEQQALEEVVVIGYGSVKNQI